MSGGSFVLAFILSSDLELWYLVGFQRKKKIIVQ